MKARSWLGLFVLASSIVAIGTVLALEVPSHGLVSSAKAQEDTASMQLDMDPNNGSGPCNPVDDSVAVSKGSEYTVAICLTGAAEAPSTWEAHIDHDNSIGQCIPMDCPEEKCLDSNPDANAGSTTWGTSIGPTNWDCSIMGIVPPTCQDINGQVTIDCVNITDRGTLPVGADVSSPLAVAKFKAVKEGTDHLSISAATAATYDVIPLFDCSPDVGGPCEGGSVQVVPPGTSLTPVVTVAPGETVPPADAAGVTATAAALAPAATAAAATSIAQGTPIAAVDQAATATTIAAATKAVGATKTAVAAKATAKPSATEEKDGGSSGPDALLIAGIVVGVAVVGGGVGWFGYRRLRRR